MRSLSQKSAVVACLVLATITVSYAFSPSLIVGHYTPRSFVSSARIPSLRPARSGRASPALSVLQVSAALKNADKVGKTIPGNWKEGKDYTMGGQVQYSICHVDRM